MLLADPLDDLERPLPNLCIAILFGSESSTFYREINNNNNNNNSNNNDNMVNFYDKYIQLSQY